MVAGVEIVKSMIDFFPLDHKQVMGMLFVAVNAVLIFLISFARKEKQASLSFFMIFSGFSVCVVYLVLSSVRGLDISEVIFLRSSASFGRGFSIGVGFFLGGILVLLKVIISRVVRFFI